MIFISFPNQVAVLGDTHMVLVCWQDICRQENMQVIFKKVYTQKR